MNKFMKSFSVIALGLFISMSAFAYQDDGNVHLTQGSSGSNADAVRVYMLARYPEVAQQSAGIVGLSQGDVVLSDAVSADGITINVAGKGTSIDAVIGVVVSPTITTADQAGTAVTDMGHRNWGYIQTYGLCSSIDLTTAAPDALGGAIYASATARRGTKASILATSSSSQARVLGFAYTTTATTTQATKATGFIATN